MDFDVAIVGAGPAGIAAALTLAGARPDLSVALIEAGRPYRRRPCPVDRGLACTGCAGICNVISGFGGCMHHGDGVKLSLLPSGRRLADLFGNRRAQALCDEAFDLQVRLLGYRPHLSGTGIADSVISIFAEGGLGIREYPVAVLSESELSTLLANAHAELTQQITLLEQSEVDRIVDYGDSYELSIGAQRLSARWLVMATGRRGVTKLRSLLDGHGVQSVPPDISMGVRFEMRADLLHEIGLHHPDLKISQRTAGGHKTKMFCFCGGPNGGRIKFTNYQDSFGDAIITLDGHETTERTAGDRPLAANFGMLCQLRRGDSVSTRDAIIADYRKLSGGRPLVQTLAAFLRRRPDATEWSELFRATSFEPSVSDLIGGQVDALFTATEHADLVRGFHDSFGAILRNQASTATIEDLAHDILVIGPEIEFLWDRIVLDHTCRVPGTRIFVAGDSAGIAQGIIQAAMMGVQAAHAIAVDASQRRQTAVPG